MYNFLYFYHINLSFGINLIQFCILVYDPDPMSSLRKRRLSTDSHESVGSGGPNAAQHFKQQQQQKPAKMFKSEKSKTAARASSPSLASPSPTKMKAVKTAKRDKVRKGAKQRFAVRSPPRAMSGSNPGKSDESSEDSNEESDAANNSSDEEVRSSFLAQLLRQVSNTLN